MGASQQEVLTVVDVGASVGLLAAHMAKLPQVRVMAIEPLPDIAAKIPRGKNIKVLEVGIRDTIKPVNQVLNRSHQSELSSFSQINPDVDGDLWAYHLPLAAAKERVVVPTVSLAWVFHEYAIDRVNFLKIDAQGLDLEVLRSCGAFAASIDCICLEVPYSSRSALYADEPNAAAAIAEVDRLGFTPVRLVPNGAGEANLFAANSAQPIDRYFYLEARLRFKSAPTLKIGPHKRPISSRLRSIASAAVAKTFPRT